MFMPAPMDVEECIRNRRSIRKYLSTPVSMDNIGRILEAARLAPTAGNLQNYKLVLVRDRDRIRKIAEAALQQYWIETAPVVIVVVSEPQRAKQFYGDRGEHGYSIMNCAIISEHMCLAAHNAGLATCMVGAFDQTMLHAAVGAPDYVKVELIVTVGYPDEKVPTPERYKMTDMVFLEKFGSRIANLDTATRVWSSTVEKNLNKSKDIFRRGSRALFEGIRDKTIKVKESFSKKKL